MVLPAHPKVEKHINKGAFTHNFCKNFITKPPKKHLSSNYKKEH
jgi:hypothetical protein